MSAEPKHSRLVRAVGEQDLDGIAAIYAHYVEHTYITFDTSAPSPEEWRVKLRAAEREGHPWLLSEADGTLHGYALTFAFKSKPAYRFTLETSIYLDPRSVGMGLGRELYEKALSDAGARGFHVAVAGIALPNPRSVALHQSLGFQPVGIFREVGHKLGDWRDVGWWQRPLSLT
ncbi:MAG TPA: GNAT family N-acetyltransferase [Solirubrobacteraceae bacterium]|jgi:phosphinothricin acetyltransferase